LLAKAGILPKLRLGLKLPKGGVQSTGSHKVKILEDKIIKKPDVSGKMIEWVRYFVEENGEKKVYDTKLKDKVGGLSYLVQRFAEIGEGEEVVLEMKKQGVKNYVEVTPIGHASSVEVEEDVEDIDEEPREPMDEETQQMVEDIPF
jgi:hypothetical protein